LTRVSYALRVENASFVRDGVELVAPFSLVLPDGGDATLAAPSGAAATILARICAAIVKPTFGTVYVGDFETRLQPPQAKRLVGFVDAAGFRGDAHAFACEVAFRAEVWGLDRRAARERASEVLSRLGEPSGDPYASAVALALVANVRLVVLDRPPVTLLPAIRELVPAAGILSVRIAAPAALVAREASTVAL
jgi:ABC-2 type transport system ATP-binding protein